MNQDEMKGICDPARLKLSVLRAFIGELTENMAGIIGTISNSKITLFVYFFADADEVDRDHVDVATTEILADYPDSFALDTRLGLITDVSDLRLPWFLLRAEAKEMEK